MDFQKLTDIELAKFVREETNRGYYQIEKTALANMYRAVFGKELPCYTCNANLVQNFTELRKWSLQAIRNANPCRYRFKRMFADQKIVFKGAIIDQYNLSDIVAEQLLEHPQYKNIIESNNPDIQGE
jgi:hypothetical protein